MLLFPAPAGPSMATIMNGKHSLHVSHILAAARFLTTHPENYLLIY
jgi:hypothetical protein